MPESIDWTDITLDDVGSSKEEKTKTDEIKVEVEEEKPDVVEATPQGDVPVVDGEEEKRRETRVQRLKRQRDDERGRTALLVQELESLKAQVGQLTQVQTEAIKVGQERFKETREAMKASLKKEWGDAFDVGDKDKILEIQGKLLSLDKEDPGPRIPETRTLPTQQPQPRQADPRALDWHKENKWFNPQASSPVEIAATAFALKKSEELVEEGYDPSSDDYYREIDKAVAQTFPQVKKPAAKSEGKPEKKSPVAGASRGSVSENTIRLSPSEVKAAQDLGVDLKTYAKRKKEVEMSDSGYTVISL